MTVARKPARPRRRRWLIAGVVALALVLGGGYWFLSRRQSADTDLAAGPQTVSVAPRVYRATVAGPGTLAAAAQRQLVPEVSGIVAAVAAVGERVVAGQEIAQLDPTPFERTLRDAELARAKAEAQLASLEANQADSSGNLDESIANAERSVEAAQRDTDRTREALALSQRLFDLGSESEEALQAARDAFDKASENLAGADANLATLKTSQGLRATADTQERRNAELAIEQAQLDLERAQEDLAATAIVAPFDGVVTAVAAEVGERASTAGALITVMDDRSLELAVQIDETEIGLVQLGQRAEVLLDAQPDETFVGEVTTISPVGRIQQNIPIFDVTIALDNPELVLRPGMTAEAEIVVREVDSTVTVPSRAVQSVRGRSYIQVEQPDGTFELTPALAIDTVGFNTILQAELPPGAVVLVPDEAPAAGQPQTGNQQRGPFPFGGRGQ